MRRLALALALAAAAALPAAAAPFAVQLGDTRVGLDAPPGFSDSNFTGSPRLQELAESLTSASNRILLFAITDADLRAFMQGDPPAFRRYTLVVTPKGLERDHVSPAAFARFVGDALRDLGPPAPPGDYRKHLGTQAEGKPHLLAELRRSHDVVTILQGSRLPAAEGKDEPRYLLSTTTLLWLRGKALNVSAYTAWESAADLDWIMFTTQRWIEDLLRLNGK